MKAQKLFETIVITLLSDKPVRPDVLRQNVADYAKLTNVSYKQARAAVVWAASERLRQRLQVL
jgi:hypothetical protein